MQYTGLKDRNGVEIFEDDIILINGVHKMQVVFHRGAFAALEICSMVLMQFGDTYLHELSNIQDHLQSCEVIGNLMQHPHLQTLKQAGA